MNPLLKCIVEDNEYRTDDGFVMAREDGLTPNGNPVAWRWVLRDNCGNWVDFDRYRHDLAERNGFRVELL